MTITAAAIQMTSGRDVRANLESGLALLRRAAGMGAAVAALPENWLAMRSPGDPPPAGLSLDGPELAAVADIARSSSMHILAGTIAEAIPGRAKVYNTSVLIGPDGTHLAVYRKIHLFDTSISGGETHKESDCVEPGRDVVIAGMPFCKAGLSVCYDLRFPELYRRMALGGAQLFFVPAAFTLHTGRDHWITLLRARAIENLCFVIAPGQFGRNTENRATFGRSAIIDPWGAVPAQAPDTQCVITAELDFDRQRRTRSELPCLEHVKRSLFDIPGRF